jgi:hypothetical protein
VDGSGLLETEGATTISSGLMTSGAVEWENTGTVTQSVGTVFIGDSNGDSVILDNLGTYDITDDSGMSDGSSTTSSIQNAGLFEKTGGTGTSVITSNVTNDGTILVSSGKLELEGAVTGTGTDTISGSSKLEFGEGVYTSAQGGQDIDFTGGGGGTLALLEPASFYGEISNFGPGDTIKLEDSWKFSALSEVGNMTTLTLHHGSTKHAFEFVGDYTRSDFSITPGKITTIGYA